jgi:phage terminase large subunit-like protein
LTLNQTDAILHDWNFFARKDQLPPPGDWRTWLFLAGRGAGKTRSAAEFIRAKIKSGCHSAGLIAPTAAAARDVMVEGAFSGMLAVCWSNDRDNNNRVIGVPQYEPSKRRLTWANGAIATCYSAEEPDRLRGPQHDVLWCDELAAWATPTAAWDMAMFGLRLGVNPQVVVSTTPRPIGLIKDLVKSKTCVITRAQTYDNRANLAGAFLDQIIAKYEGTRLGRQELAGEILEEIEGALWNYAMLDKARIPGTGEPPNLHRVVVAVDPSGCSGPDDKRSDEIGIVVVGMDRNGVAYLLQDASGHYSPDQWANMTIRMFDSWGANMIVAEKNFGGAMVDSTIRSVRKNAPVRLVTASRGKFQRAEPVAALYEQGKVRHFGAFSELEDQLCSFAANGYMGERSPDRADALIWGITELMLSMATPRAVMGSY